MLTSTNKLADFCLICNKPISTSHLQVNICYGCAAFYRRSVNSQKSYKCKYNNKKCDLKSQKILCRLCRYNQCQKLNLVINKNKESSSSLASFKLSPISDDSSTDPWNVVDMFHQIHIAFKENKRITNDNYYSSFTNIISQFYEAIKPKQDLVPMKSEFIRIWFKNKFAINSAKLLSRSNEFQRLPLNEKLIIFDKFWQNFWYLVLFYETYELFGPDSAFKGIVDNYQYIDTSTLRKVYYLNSSSYGTKLFVEPIREKIDKCFNEFKMLNATFNELVYICILTLWSFHGLPKLSQTTQDLSNKILQDASKNLHEYYTNELRMSNYAARQAKLFKIAKIIDNIFQDKNETLKTWEFFNYGQQAFPWCKFDTNYYTYKNF